MKRRMIALSMMVLLLLNALCPFARAEETVSARTPLYDAGEAKLNNIELAAEAINGLSVGYGEQFSFNETVGPRTRSRGYRSAANGRGVKVTGGGVSQVATTLYLALLEVADSVHIDSLATYGSRFTDTYVADGSLAVITDYSAGTDFQFTNYASDMLIEMWSDGSYLYCSITLGGGSAGAGGWFDGWTGGGTTAPPATQTRSAQLNTGGESGVVHNATLAAESIYDTTLASGDVFSFNKIVGPRTGQYGYVSGTNGRGVKVTGGGVAQVASVIWLVVKDMDDIAVLEKSTYGGKYNQAYVSNSADAIVTDYKADTDFRFRYTGKGTITLYTYVNGETLYCDIVKNG